MSFFEEKCVVVTGASRGIGAAVADAFADRGARVIGTATTQQGADGITERLRAFGQHHHGAVLDIADKSSIAAFGKSVLKTTVPFALINNAAITRDSLFLRMKEEDWQSVIDTNLTSIYRICSAFIRPMLKARSGRIINIASIVAATGNPGQTNYVAAKAGVVGFTKSLAMEIAAKGITVNTILPGFIDTDMTKTLPESLRVQLLAKIPMATMGTPEDIAAAALYLGGIGGRYVTGAALHVNGGMYMN